MSSPAGNDGFPSWTLAEEPPPSRRRRWLKRGLVVGVPLLAVASVVLALQQANVDAQVPHPGEVALSDLAVGDCVQVTDGLAEAPSTLPARSCTQAHNAEVFQVEAFPEGSFPGSADVQKSAQAYCQAGAGQYLGGDASTTELSLADYFPSARSWANGDRSYICLFVADGAPLKASLRGSLSGVGSG